jgi:hypothetical protein
MQQEIIVLQQHHAEEEEQNERRAAESMDHSWMPLQSTPTNTRDACMHTHFHVFDTLTYAFFHTNRTGFAC